MASDNFIVSALPYSAQDKKTANLKAKDDMIFFLKKRGFKSINLNNYKNKLSKVILSEIEINLKLGKVKSGDYVIVQYPFYSRYIENTMMRLLKKRGVMVVALIHDLESLRLYSSDSQKAEKEIKYLNSFDAVISHNTSMTHWLLEHGLKVKTVDLGIFDYNENSKIKTPSFKLPIVFAGNLKKSKFLDKLSLKKRIDLFGIGNRKEYPININYKGAYPADELADHLNGSFGLIWDGDSADTSSGVMGNYNRYNNPHKASLYLSLGIPVIIWNEAALAEFVKEKKVGITINSLSELDNVLSNMTENDYQVMVNNSKKIAEKLRNGFYLMGAVERSKR